MKVVEIGDIECVEKEQIRGTQDKVDLWTKRDY